VYEVVVTGCAERTVRLALEDLVDAWDASDDGRLALEIVDQSRLLVVIDRLHDLGLVIEHVQHR
jgi:hypothetical protein